MNFLSRIKMLYRIVVAQKATRIILRAAWLGGAVYLLCWGVNGLWGVLPRSNYWVLFAVIVSFGTLATLLFKPSSQQAFLWRVDGRFDLKEQVSTAYEVAIKKEGSRPAEQPLEKLLIEDADRLMPGITRKVIDKGWGIRDDVESTVIVLMMLLIVYLSGMESFSTAIPGSGLGILPGLGSDPTFRDVFSSGIPGDTSGSAGGLSFGGEGVEATEGSQDLSTEGLNLVYEVFREMGEALKDSAATSELGVGLAGMDFERAAQEMGTLSDNIDQVTTETRQNLADHFSDAVRKLYLSQFSDISDILGSAAESLRGSSTTEMSTQLDRVAGMLHSLSDLRVNEVITGVQDPPEMPEFEGLEGEGDELEFETPEEVSDLLTAPGSGSVPSGEAQDGVVDFEGYSIEIFGDGIWSPFDYSWDDKDVVSSYFAPR
jgi:hypothetical protein